MKEGGGGDPKFKEASVRVRANRKGGIKITNWRKNIAGGGGGGMRENKLDNQEVKNAEL